MRRSVLLLSVAALLLVLPGSVIASASYPVTIVVPTDFALKVWPFSATGEAVDEGLICPSGTVTDGKYVAACRRDGSACNFRIEKVFVCDEGGSFTINLQAHVVFDPYSDVGTWTILHGWDDMARIHGNGTLVGEPFVGGVTDTYVGLIHED
jgi:hypothetical protein